MPDPPVLRSAPPLGRLNRALTRPLPMVRCTGPRVVRPCLPRCAAGTRLTDSATHPVLVAAGSLIRPRFSLHPPRRGLLALPHSKTLTPARAESAAKFLSGHGGGRALRADGPRSVSSDGCRKIRPKRRRKPAHNAPPRKRKIGRFNIPHGLTSRRRPFPCAFAPPLARAHPRSERCPPVDGSAPVPAR